MIYSKKKLAKEVVRVSEPESKLQCATVFFLLYHRFIIIYLHFYLNSLISPPLIELFIIIDVLV